MSDDFEHTVRLNPSKTFLPKPIVRRDVLSQIKGSQEAAIRFNSNRVSRLHAKLYTSGNDYYCEDLGSHNGLLLNGIRVHAVALRDGDTLQIGDIVLIYHQGVQWASM
jgi:pSer/pThr/pTyr-binding forkhead associated (FHA) protein